MQQKTKKVRAIAVNKKSNYDHNEEFFASFPPSTTTSSLSISDLARGKFELPLDIINHIFHVERITNASWLHSISLVCKEFNAAVKDFYINVLGRKPRKLDKSSLLFLNQGGETVWKSNTDKLPLYLPSHSQSDWILYKEKDNRTLQLANLETRQIIQ